MEKGLVIETQNNKMTVRFTSSEACKKCGGCAVKDGYAVLSDLDNTVDAKVGDTVVMENNAGNMLTAASIIYLIPVAALVGGYFTGLFFSSLINVSEKFAVFTALLVFGLSFFVISNIDKRFAKKPSFQPKIIKKI